MTDKLDYKAPSRVEVYGTPIDGVVWFSLDDACKGFGWTRIGIRPEDILRGDLPMEWFRQVRRTSIPKPKPPGDSTW